MKGNAKKFFALLAALSLLAAWAPARSFAADVPEPVFSMNDSLDAIAGEYTENTVNGVDGVSLNGVSGLRYDGLEMDFGKPFTISFAVQIDQYASGFAVMTAVNPKAAGHVEVYLQEGKMMFYAPEVNGNIPVESGISVMDGQLHLVACSYDGATFRWYDNGMKINEWPVTGTVANIGSTILSIGDLNEGSMPFSGFIGDLRIFDSALSEEQMAAVSSPKEEEDVVVDTEPKLLAALAEEGVTLEAGVGENTLQSEFVHNLGETFTIAAQFSAAPLEGIQILFAKGTKATPGHFEVYLEENGELAFYAPELANNNSVRSGVILNDGENHAFAVTYDGSSMTFYIDGEATNTMEVSGTLSNKTTAFRIGQLVENGFGYTGTIRNIRLYNYALTEADALALSGGTGAEPDDNPDVPNIPTGDGASWAALAAVLLPAAMVLALRRRAKV